MAQSSCGALVGENRIADPDFADDAGIIIESLDVLRSTHLSLSEEAEALGLRGSWVKIKI